MKVLWFVVLILSHEAVGMSTNIQTHFNMVEMAKRVTHDVRSERFQLLATAIRSLNRFAQTDDQKMQLQKTASMIESAATTAASSPDIMIFSLMLAEGISFAFSDFIPDFSDWLRKHTLDSGQLVMKDVLMVLLLVGYIVFTAPCLTGETTCYDAPGVVVFGAVAGFIAIILILFLTYVIISVFFSKKEPSKIPEDSGNVQSTAQVNNTNQAKGSDTQQNASGGQAQAQVKASGGQTQVTVSGGSTQANSSGGQSGDQKVAKPRTKTIEKPQRRPTG
eukprot:c8225_g1_i1.p1 GENE.c8225_g1_i1~~c8225_g1_i1.p1  ORF type:complete len:277 (-),score=74.95 c8225_g1_i1:2-832(-)